MFKRLFLWARARDSKLKFLMVGCLNTLIGYGGYLLVMLAFGHQVFKFNDAPGWHTAISIASGQVVAAINSFFWNKLFTFESSKKSKAEVLRFVVYSIGLFLADYCLKQLLLRNVLNLQEILITIISFCVLTPVSYATQRFFVFPKKGQKQHDKTADNLKDSSKTETELPNDPLPATNPSQDIDKQHII